MPKRTRETSVVDLTGDAPVVMRDRTNDAPAAVAGPGPATKKARVSDPTNAEKVVAQVTAREVQPSEEDQDEEDDDDGPVFDDCNDVRRKITAYLKEPGVKITPWLKQLGVNSNSYQRYMKAKGPTGGAGNGMYYAAYHFFEKKRIAEGKPKSKKRLQNEASQYGGFELQERRGVWVIGR